MRAHLKKSENQFFMSTSCRFMNSQSYFQSNSGSLRSVLEGPYWLMKLEGCPEEDYPIPNLYCQSQRGGQVLQEPGGGGSDWVVSQGDRDVVVIDSANNNYLSSIQSKQDAKKYS